MQAFVRPTNNFSCSSWNYGSYCAFNPSYISQSNQRIQNNNNIVRQNNNIYNRYGKRVLKADERIVTNEYLKGINYMKEMKKEELKRTKSANGLRKRTYREKEDNNNEINNEDEKYEIDEKAFEKVDVVKTMKNDQKNIKIIYNLLENEEVKAKRDEEKREIIKLKNQLDDVLKSIEVELNRNDEQIDDIEERVDNGLNQVVEGNDDNLEKAAISAVKRRRLAYQGGLALALGAIGTVVPGIGNAIGLAAGGLIGYGLYRIDKHRLKKALKKKKKIREEKDNK